MPAEAVDGAYALVAVVRALRERRKASGKSLEALAEEAGMDRGLLGRIERGAVPNPTVGTPARVAAALGARITLGGEGGAMTIWARHPSTSPANRLTA